MEAGKELVQLLKGIIEGIVNLSISGGYFSEKFADLERAVQSLAQYHTNVDNLEILRQQFEQAYYQTIQAISQRASEAHRDDQASLQSLAQIAADIKAKFESALESQQESQQEIDPEFGDGESNEINPTLSWADETERATQGLLKSFTFPDEKMDCADPNEVMPRLVPKERSESSTESESDTEQSEVHEKGTNDNVPSSETEQNHKSTVSETPSKAATTKIMNAAEMKIAIEKAQSVTNEHQLQRAILNQPGEFNLYTLYMYNRALNELNNIPMMPERARPSDYRALRDFITSFLTLVNNIKIGTHYIEPILLGRLVASLNENTLSVWSYALRKERASIATMRSFLTNQEEIAQDTWIFEQRHAPPSASRAVRPNSNSRAQVKSNSEQPNPIK